MTKLSPKMKFAIFFFAEPNATFFLCHYFHGPELLMKNTWKIQNNIILNEQDWPSFVQSCGTEWFFLEGVNFADTKLSSNWAWACFILPPVELSKRAGKYFIKAAWDLTETKIRHILHGDYIAVIADSNLMIKKKKKIIVSICCLLLVFTGTNCLQGHPTDNSHPLVETMSWDFYSHWDWKEIKSAEFSILLMNPTKIQECSSPACYLSVSLREVFDNPVYSLML